MLETRGVGAVAAGELALGATEVFGAGCVATGGREPREPDWVEGGAVTVRFSGAVRAGGTSLVPLLPSTRAAPEAVGTARLGSTFPGRVTVVETEGGVLGSEGR